MILLPEITRGKMQPTKEQFEAVAKFMGITLRPHQKIEGFAFSWTPNIPSKDAYELLAKIEGWRVNGDPHTNLVRDRLVTLIASQSVGDVEGMASSAFLLAAEIGRGME